MKQVLISALGILYFTCAVPLASAQQAQPEPTPQQRAQMLKQWMQLSAQQIRAYQWVESTVVSKDGEEKSREQDSCFYGPDGTLQKVTLSKSAGSEKVMPGILPLGMLANKIAEKKAGEVTEYIGQAKELLKSYVPPVPSLIQRAMDSGNLSVQALDPGRRVRLTLANYLKAGDTLSVDVELPTNRLLAVTANTYMDTPQDVVTLNVTMGVLPDGTIYAAQSVLDAKSKGVVVTVQNEGYRKAGT